MLRKPVRLHRFSSLGTREDLEFHWQSAQLQADYRVGYQDQKKPPACAQEQGNGMQLQPLAEPFASLRDLGSQILLIVSRTGAKHVFH